MLKSIGFKFIYGAVVGVLALLFGWVEANPDPASWTMVSFKLSMLTGIVALGKKLLFAAFTSS